MNVVASCVIGPLLLTVERTGEHTSVMALSSSVGRFDDQKVCVALTRESALRLAHEIAIFSSRLPEARDLLRETEGKRSA